MAALTLYLADTSAWHRSASTIGRSRFSSAKNLIPSEKLGE